MDTEMTSVKKILGGISCFLLLLVACNKDPDITPDDDDPSGGEIVVPEDDPYYFFSDEDLESIRKNLWGAMAPDKAVCRRRHRRTYGNS